jgi:hypothetical protein
MCDDTEGTAGVGTTSAGPIKIARNILFTYYILSSLIYNIVQCLVSLVPL